jgi:hypothetical protein
MLAPLVINLLYVCITMLVTGWVYDRLHASASLGPQDTHLATELSAPKICQEWSSPHRTGFHA